MSKKSIVALGLPESGKTTFLAALWHLLTNKKVQARLRLVKLAADEAAYLKTIAARWAQAKKQDRTFQSGSKIVALTLQAEDSEAFDLTFPDIAGEAFSQMWEMRECTPAVAGALRATGVLLFIHVDKIKAPGWTADDAALGQGIGVAQVGEPAPWKPQLTPTQVQLVDILGCLQKAPLDVGPRRLAVILSAWDKAEAEEVPPERFLQMHLPLLHQYLTHGLGTGWKQRIFGVSAQGADYDNVDGAPSADADRMREMEVPSQRIKVVVGSAAFHDLTEPVHWLLE